MLGFYDKLCYKKMKEIIENNRVYFIQQFIFIRSEIFRKKNIYFVFKMSKNDKF